jgi:hypothetical protein
MKPQIKVGLTMVLFCAIVWGVIIYAVISRP